MPNTLPDIPILLVDDSVLDLALCRCILEEQGIPSSSILEASTLQKAQEILASHPPQICVIDYVLPDGRGIDLLHFIRDMNEKNHDIGQHISSILVTGSGDEKLVADLFRAGACDYLVKRDLIESFSLSVERALEHRSSVLERKRRAAMDPVTSLWNRATFLERGQELLLGHQVAKERCAIIYIDLDEFKEINDTYGHATGDLFLKESAERILNLCRSSDLAARIGGDEFVVLLRDISRCDLILKVDSWMKSNEVPFENMNIEGGLRCSVGVSIASIDTLYDLQTLMDIADNAMYKAKQTGKNRYAFSSGGTQSNGQEIENFPSAYNSHHIPSIAIRRALVTNEFQLFFQPIRDAHSLKIEAFEVLVRWPNMPKKLSVEQVFCYLSQFNLFAEFHRWFVPSVLNITQRWHDEGCPISFSINAPECRDGCESLLRELRDSLEELGQNFHKSSISVEISERALNTDPEFFNLFSDQLLKLGFSTSLDQFSRVETKLANLTRNSFKSVKVRRYDFNKSQEKEFEKVLRISSFIRLSMGCDLIAVGIESLEELVVARAAGVDGVQGNFVGYPRVGRKKWADFIDQYEILDNKSLQ